MLSTSFRRDTLRDGLVLDLQFSEGSGGRVWDRSGKGNNGTLINSPSWVDGVSGKALSFDGVADYVTVAHNDSLNVLGSYTWSAWYRRDTDNVAAFYIFSKGSGSNNANFLFIQTGTGSTYPNRVQGGHGYDGLWRRVTSDTVITVGIWYMVTCVYDSVSKTLTMYINGVYDNVAINVESPTPNNTNFTVAYLSPVYAVCSVDQILLWNRALSATEIMFLYKKVLRRIS